MAVAKGVEDVKSNTDSPTGVLKSRRGLKISFTRDHAPSALAKATKTPPATSAHRSFPTFLRRAVTRHPWLHLVPQPAA